MSLLLNMLSRLVITFLPRSKHLLISLLQSPSAVILESPKIKYVTLSIVSPSMNMKWWDQMPWSSFFECWDFSQLFHPLLSFSSRGSLVPLRFLWWGWCHLSIWGYWYFSQQAWFQPVLHIAWLFTWYTAYNLNKQCDNIQPWCTPFLIWNQSAVPRPVLTVASWTTYRFLKR